MPLLSDLHLKLRGAFMFHMFGWAFCLSMRVSFAMHAVQSGVAAHRGNEPVRVCCDRRDLYDQDVAGYTEEWNMDELQACAVQTVVSRDPGGDQDDSGMRGSIRNCMEPAGCDPRDNVSTSQPMGVNETWSLAGGVSGGQQGDCVTPAPDSALCRGARRIEYHLRKPATLDDYGVYCLCPGGCGFARDDGHGEASGELDDPRRGGRKADSDMVDYGDEVLFMQKRELQNETLPDRAVVPRREGVPLPTTASSSTRAKEEGLEGNWPSGCRAGLPFVLEACWGWYYSNAWMTKGLSHWMPTAIQCVYQTGLIELTQCCANTHPGQTQVRRPRAPRRGRRWMGGLLDPTG